MSGVGKEPLVTLVTPVEPGQGTVDGVDQRNDLDGHADGRQARAAAGDVDPFRLVGHPPQPRQRTLDDEWRDEKGCHRHQSDDEQGQVQHGQEGGHDLMQQEAALTARQHLDTACRRIDPLHDGEGRRVIATIPSQNRALHRI